MIDRRPTPTRQQQADWLAEAARLHPAERFSLIAEHVARLAYAAGADAELEACYARQHLIYGGDCADQLRAARRPKPQSLKQQGRDALAQIMSQQVGPFDGKPFDVLGRAIEALPEEAA